MFRFIVTVLVSSCTLSTYAAQLEPSGTVSTESKPSPASIGLEEQRREARKLWLDGKIAQAAKQYREILDVSEKSGHRDPHLAGDLYANGSLAVEMDQLSEAQAYFQRALNAAHSQPLSDAEVRSSLGSLFALQGSFSQAETYLKSSIQTFTEHAGANDLRTARAWNVLGWIYTASGEINQATDAVQKAETITDRVLPPDSVERIPFLDHHAELLSQIGKYSDAERLWREAARIDQTSRGYNDSQFDVILLHMGHMYASIGEYEPAQEALEHFLSIEQRVMAEGSLAQAIALGELGNTYAHMKDHSEAEPTLKQSIEMLRTIPGKVPLANALVGTYLGDYLMSQQRWSEAADQYRRSLETRQAVVPHTALVANTMTALSRALEKLKQKAEAKRYRKAAEAILSEQSNPFNSGNTVDVKSFRAR